ncbi:MAG TPA: hypothetical protein DC064_16760 [Cyanobacteria bacterium UBA9273]|nr:hypothetical protein [Cyanobacteria bacterium UBA9273]
MTHRHSPEDVASHNQNSLNILLRTIARSQGNFSLILARCNYGLLRERIVQELVEQLLELEALEIQHVVLQPSVNMLYSTIEAKLGQEQPKALMVFGLESVSNLDQMLRATNRVREEFRNFAFPLVLWVTDEVLQKLIRLVPDFESWATSVEFAIATDELIQFIQQTTDKVFACVLDAGASLFLDNAALNLGMGSPGRAELESAKKELERQGVSLDPELEASLEFVLGRDADGSLERSRHHYERSLTLWQQSDNLERRGCLLFFLGLWWRTYAVAHRNEYDQACCRAKDYFQQAVEVFEEANRTDLVTKFINALGDVLQRLEYWDELEAVAQKALALHQTHLDLFRLARVYGFLAEVALARSQWMAAREFAQKALSVLEDAQTTSSASAKPSIHLDWERSFHRGWYLFSLAKAYSSLGHLRTALDKLEAARATTKSQYDPELYIRILEELRSLYFKRGEYLKAFQTKQERRSIEQQYGFRAFIGAGRLQPKQQVTNPALPYIKQERTAAQEIAASGRQEDVNRLVERLRRDDYKLTIIHGQSGVGKSSLVQAGLIPALKHQKIGTRDALPILQQVYTDWCRQLGECLAQALVETQNCLNTSISTLYSLPELTCSLANMPDSVTLNSTAAILAQLHHNVENNFLTIIIFDQFEEFFFVGKDQKQRQVFYEFLRDALNIPYVKIILSLREDYLHYLLECNNRLIDLEAINNNILDKNILYYLGNFTPENTKFVVQSLTDNNQFHLEQSLINQLVKDLAEELGEVRPIELQVVGEQLQTERITTLDKYREHGPKSQLVERFLTAVVKDCGTENERIAQLVLYLLTDENNNRPLKTQDELAAGLEALGIEVEPQHLNLVLDILVGSGLLFLVPASPKVQYQLVHDYLVTFIRQQQKDGLVAELEEAKAQKQRAEAELNRVLSQALQQEAELRKRAEIGEIKALSSSATALLASNQELEALIEALRMGRRLKEYFGDEAKNHIQALTALQKVVYGVRERNRLEKHGDTVLSVCFSPDSKIVASSDGGYHTIKLWSLDGTLLQTLQGHSDDVMSILFSPDGKLIASASFDKTVKLWSIEGKLLRTFEGHTHWVYSVTFSPDGQMLVSGSGDRTIKLWSLDGCLLKTLAGHHDKVTSVNFSPNGQLIASSSYDRTVKLWSTNGRLCRTLHGHNDEVNSVQFSPDGQILASASRDNTVKLWSIEGTLLKTLQGHSDSVESVSFSPNGKTLASGSFDNSVKLWSPDGMLLKTLQGHSARVYKVCFSPDAQTLASASTDQTVKLWSLDEILLKTIRGHLGYVISVCFSPDGQTIASASNDQTVKLWSLDGTLIQNLQGHDDAVYNVSFSPNGRTIASASWDKTVKLWSIDGNLLGTLAGHRDTVTSVSFSPDNNTIASASKDGTVKLWNLQGHLLRTIQGHTDKVTSVSFSPDGQTMASSSYDRTVKLWRVDGTLLQTLQGHEDVVYDLGFSPDGQIIASASFDKTVRLWSINGTLLKTILAHSNEVNSVSFSPDGKTIASSSDDSTVKLWNLNGELLKSFQGHNSRVNAISFSPDGKTIASAGFDKTIILWNLEQWTMDLDALLLRGCNWVRDYLKNSPKIEQSDRHLCDSIGNW